MKLIKYFFEFLFFISLFILFRFLGLKISSSISSFLFFSFGPLFRKKKIIAENIKLAFPDIENKKLEKLIESMWNNYGKIFAEYVFLKKFRKRFDQTYVEIEICL